MNYKSKPAKTTPWSEETNHLEYLMEEQQGIKRSVVKEKAPMSFPDSKNGATSYNFIKS